MWKTEGCFSNQGVYSYLQETASHDKNNLESFKIPQLHVPGVLSTRSPQFYSTTHLMNFLSTVLGDSETDVESH